MIRFWKRRAAAAVLGVCVLFSACGQTPSAPAREPVKHAEIDFNTLEYTRPDTDALNDKIDAALARVENGDPDDVLALYDSILADLSSLDTMHSLASIRYNLDLSDTFYKEEELALGEAYTRLDNRMNELTAAILASGFADDARAHWGDAFVRRYEENSKLNSPQIEALSAQEQALVSEYQQRSTEAFSVERDGVQLTLDDLDLTQDADIDLYYEIYAQRNAVLGQIYCELVQVRTKIAQTLGYDNYTDYAYDLLGRDFTKEDAALFSDAVKEYLAPVYTVLYWQDAVSSVAPGAQPSLEDGLPVLQQALKENGYPEAMSDAMDYMLAHNLYTFADGGNCMESAYTTLLSEYGAPYLFINTDYYTDPSTLFHEFGHYYNFYLMGQVHWNDNTNLDLAEIHSQGLEILMFDTYEELYGEYADDMQASLLTSTVATILSGCAEDEFQQAVFENPDMTLDEMNELHGEIYESYFGYRIDYEWVDIHHHFETPFYYISYATSAISSLELWMDMLDSRTDAMQIYDQLTQYTLNAEYRDALREVGLSDPFTSDCTARIARALIRELLELPQAA